MQVYYENEMGRLYHGDCLEVMDWLPIEYGPNCFDMVLTDPPYGTTQNNWDSVIPLEPMWKGVWENVKENGAVVMTAATPFDKVLGASDISRLKYEWVWQKNKASGHLNAKKMPLRSHENVMVFYRKLPTYNPQMTEGHGPLHYAVNGRSENYGEYQAQESRTGATTRYPKTTLPIPVLNNDDPGRVHPTQKPVALFAYLISTYTNLGETVLDFCAGSGTTAVAAESIGRKWVLIEKEEKYCEIIAKRLDAKKN